MLKHYKIIPHQGRGGESGVRLQVAILLYATGRQIVVSKERNFWCIGAYVGEINHQFGQVRFVVFVISRCILHNISSVLVVCVITGCILLTSLVVDFRFSDSTKIFIITNLYSI